MSDLSPRSPSSLGSARTAISSGDAGERGVGCKVLDNFCSFKNCRSSFSLCFQRMCPLFQGTGGATLLQSDARDKSVWAIYRDFRKTLVSNTWCWIVWPSHHFPITTSSQPNCYVKDRWTWKRLPFFFLWKRLVYMWLVDDEDLSRGEWGQNDFAPEQCCRKKCLKVWWGRKEVSRCD